MDKWERFEKLLDSLNWVFAGLGLGLLIGMPVWMFLLGII